MILVINLRTTLKNILQLLDTLEIDQINLVVHDWGGAIGLTALGSHSERSTKNCAPKHCLSFLSQDVPKNSFPQASSNRSIFRMCTEWFCMAGNLMATNFGLNKTVKWFSHPYNNWRNREAIWNFVKDIPFEQNHPSRSTLKQTEGLLGSFLSTPILACWGMKDFCFHGASESVGRVLATWKFIGFPCRSLYSRR